MQFFKIPVAFFCCLLATAGSAFADNYPIDKRIDMRHYRFHMAVTDRSDEIEVTAFITVLFKQPGVSQLRLDLVNKAANGKGMQVDSVWAINNKISYIHKDNALLIQMDRPAEAGKEITFQIQYHGEPADGLHIGPTKYGDRSFFSDNWPNKARNWLPLIDHPSDKATCEFIVEAPLHYKVVSNGLLLEESNINDTTRLTHWKQGVPISTWLYTIGIARFAVQYVDQFEGKSIETWVFAKDREAGFYDFSVPTKDALTFFSDYVGPFVYEKLANIESPVVGGGMEAASAIGYSYKLVTGTRSVRTRNVIIHELAHQWFGNAVTENNWDDAWLSEGFATCFTMLYTEHAYGKAEFLSEWEKAKQSFKKYYTKDSTYKIVDDRTAETGEVTNIVTYQKGACILLMLRDMIGDAAFKKGIRAYYKKYMNGNATTKDFQQEMEKVSQQDLTAFFEQWLHRGDLIRLNAGWKYDPAKRKLSVTVNQVQGIDSLYVFPLDIAIQLPGNKGTVLKKVNIKKQSAIFVFSLAEKPESIKLDPRKVLLANIELITNN